MIVEADVETRPRFARNDVEGGVVRFQRRDFEVRRLEILAAVVDVHIDQRVQNMHQDRDRVTGKMRVGDMPLLADDDDRPRQAAAPAGLDGVAELLARGRLADQRRVEDVALFPRPFDQLLRAVDRRAFLIAGDGQRQRPLRLARRDEGEGGSEKRRHATLHVDGAAPDHRAVGDLAGKRRVAPARFIAGRHHVGMPGEDHVWLAAADRGEQVFDVRRILVAEGQPVHGEPGERQDLGEVALSTTVRGRHGAAGDQCLQDFSGVGGQLRHGNSEPHETYVGSGP